MEVREENGRYRNGLGELVELEAEYLYPMLKSADICREGRPRSRRWMLVTQRFVGDDTSRIRDKAPKTWEYLVRHGALLDGRASAIYRKRPRFSIFGVGDYSFALWKVAISGLYKRLEFKMVGPFTGKTRCPGRHMLFHSMSDQRRSPIACGTLELGTCKTILVGCHFLGRQTAHYGGCFAPFGPARCGKRIEPGAPPRKVSPVVRRILYRSCPTVHRSVQLERFRIPTTNA